MDQNDLKKVEENSVDIEKKRNRENKKEKSKISKVIDKIVTGIILVVCICGLIYSLSKLVPWLLANISTNSVVNDVNTIAGVGDIPKDENPGVEFGINFESLLAINPEVVGWIRIPGTSVNYALVQASDNNKYLKTLIL